MNRRFVLVSTLALAAGCANAPPDTTWGMVELEPVYRVETGADALTIDVGSSGCTAKADFAFYVDRRGGRASIAFARRRPDTCRSFAMGRTRLSFSFGELGLGPAEPFAVANPLRAWTGPASNPGSS